VVSIPPGCALPAAEGSVTLLVDCVGELVGIDIKR
jgi:hypothetical protein